MNNHPDSNHNKQLSKQMAWTSGFSVLSNDPTDWSDPSWETDINSINTLSQSWRNGHSAMRLKLTKSFLCVKCRSKVLSTNISYDSLSTEAIDYKPQVDYNGYSLEKVTFWKIINEISSSAREKLFSSGS